MTTHIFLAPHPDDAVLSCGGTIAHLTQQNKSVSIITLFAGTPPTNFAFSEFARYQHNIWGVEFQQARQIRKTEDRAALAMFNLSPTWLQFWDCIYRGHPNSDTWYYTSDPMIFGPVHPAEAGFHLEIARAITAEIDTATPCILYAPLGIGNHVDHQIVLQAALSLHKQGFPLFLYEDYPYIQREPADLNRALQTCQTMLPVDAVLQPQLNPLSSAELTLKITAIAAYATQMKILFGGEEIMRAKVAAFAHHTGGGSPAERLWAIVPRSNL